MKRKIKFRGISLLTNKWLYGWYFEYDEEHYIVPNHYISSQRSAEAKVFPLSVGQFTGLKDNNGVDIYEGDLISIGNPKYSYFVKFENGSFYMFHTENKDENNEPYRWGLLSRAFDIDIKRFGKIEIIGNIH